MRHPKMQFDYFGKLIALENTRYECSMGPYKRDIHKRYLKIVLSIKWGYD